MKNVSRNRDQKSARMFVCLAPLLILGLTGCSSTVKEKEPVVSVEVTPAEKTSVSQIVTADAVVFPLKQATVSPKITSTIADFKVQRGSRVKKGQVLAILENKDLAAQAEASKGDFEQADANYVIAVNAGLPQQLQKAELDAAAAKSAFDAAQKVYDSRKDLFQQGAIPRRDLDSAEVALAQARSQNEQAQKQLADLRRIGNDQLRKAAQGTKESAEGHYRAAAAQLSYSEIRSPIDGVVTDRPLYVGDLATANQPILTVMDTSTLVAKAHVPQAEAVLLKVGDAAEIKVPDLEDPIKGRLRLVSPALDPGSTTIEIWVEARKSNPALKPGMSVSIVMTAKTVKDAIAVPTAAVFKNADGTYYVLLAGTDKKAHQKIVQLGVKNGELTQIASGISAGDPVITSGGYAVPDGTTIEIEKPSAPEKGEAESPTDKSDLQEKKATSAPVGKEQE
ncbi:MAG TPA: efflux RND transporter periplasmic adaptor subunit [Candidatus Dormibacteraeota bacterium]|jgi:HlyD family secretion protein|nr:efflux RND transporter periplasmic adaptor subunit [Candidatus Dormibacteraeota bacterium]